MRRSIPLIVFSDLDGTLLDHDSYSWGPAKPALSRLADLGIPVVLATSKTQEETTVLQHRMGLSACPAIVENGAGLVGLGAPDATPSSDYGRLRSVLDHMPPRLRKSFSGFGDMSTQDVCRATGLALPEARRAKARAYSEPGLWTGTAQDRAAFIAEIAVHGVTARAGGRFLTLSFGGTKQDRMAEVVSHYRAGKTLALGDAPNDVEMLEAATVGVIVANPHCTPLPTLSGERSGRIKRTQKAGPEGWNTAVNAVLDEYGLTTKDCKIG